MALRGIVEKPEGFVYRDDFITEDEEDGLLSFARGLELHRVVIREQPSRRLVRHFGYGYDYENWQVREIEPLPAQLHELRRRAEAFAGLAPGGFVEALVQLYPEGAGINWHRDAGAFAEQVVGVSLASTCSMQLRRGAGDHRRVFEAPLPPRSAYLLSGAARFAWQHRIPPTRQERWSITFRALKQGRAAA